MRKGRVMRAPAVEIDVDEARTLGGCPRCAELIPEVVLLEAWFGNDVTVKCGCGLVFRIVAAG